MILLFLIFSKSFSLQHSLHHSLQSFSLSMNIEVVSKGNETKTCIDNSFDVIITKYTLRVLLAFTV